MELIANQNKTATPSHGSQLEPIDDSLQEDYDEEEDISINGVSPDIEQMKKMSTIKSNK